jgi:hypothetical protein
VKRQSEIERRDVGTEVDGNLDRRRTVERHLRVVADRFERVGGHARGVDVVVDDQNPAVGVNRR